MLRLSGKENLDKFVQGFVGCPVIIEHNEVYDDNAKELRVGIISRVWFDDTDGYYWCEGIIWDEHALDLIINKGWSVSCQYDITEVNEEGGIHNGVEFDKTILNGSPEHLALVDAPRYEAALIAVNSGKKKFLFNKAINSNDKTEWITMKGNHIPIKEGETKEEAVKTFLEKVREKKIVKKPEGKQKEEKEKQISKDYALMRSKDFVKSIEEYPNSQKEILFTNEDNTWLLVESWKKGEEGWDLVKAGKVIQHFNDRYEAYDAHEKGYFDNVDAMDKEKPFYVKMADIRPVKIKKSEIPQFDNKKELSNWMKEQFKQLGSVHIEDTGIDLKLSAGKANREAIKRRSSKDENKAVVTKFEEIVSKAIKKDERKADERHNKDQEIYYNKFQIDGQDYEVEVFVDKPDGRDKNSYYAGHSAVKIEITPRDTMDAQNELIHHAKGVNNIIPHIVINFNPDIANCKAQNNKETEEMGIVEDLEKLILKAKNKGDSMKSKNEDTDKRKLIDEVAGMMKSAGADDELIRTAIAKMEKLAYDKSEAGTADNKAKNENEEDDKKDEKADNKCRNKDDDEDDEAGNEDEDEYDKLKREVDDEAKNKAKNKARNSISDFKKSFYDYDGGGYDTGYISQKKGIELGKQVF